MQSLGEEENPMNTITLSVIIPVYNVERYLRQCLDSVLIQGVDDIEVVVVDDVVGRRQFRRLSRLCRSHFTRAIPTQRQWTFPDGVSSYFHESTLDSKHRLTDESHDAGQHQSVFHAKTLWAAIHGKET